MTHVIGILGAADRHGLTAEMLQAVLDAAGHQGCTVETIFLADEDLRLTDFRKANPAIAQLSHKLHEADCLVLASPTYWGSISGMMKNFLDCMHHELVSFTKKGERRPAGLRGRSYILVTSCFTPTFENCITGATDRTFQAMDVPLAAAGMHRIGEAVCTGTWGMTELPDSKKADCEKLGQRIPEKLKQGGFLLKRYIELFFMLALTVLIVMGIQQGLSALHFLNLSNFWINYAIFVLLAYLLLASILHYVAMRMHKRH
ncbi:NAD(P)H-dependent oxidoreductase [Sporolactobacillus sp. Y61]|uniref:NAD(P)H-dependent oxidoreductase n=1 Tax=Sporolactobacillus sp. Y61 TaxID=3160863 RepID=A0AAU8IG93_9BACL